MFLHLLPIFLEGSRHHLTLAKKLTNLPPPVKHEKATIVAQG
jgi:hypothetical protein